ncbi:MAG: rod shape-determining protein RodA [bacterium]
MRRFFQNIDIVLLLSVVPLALGGIVTMMSFTGDSKNALHQGLWFVIGVGFILLLSRINVRSLRESRYISIAFIASLFLLVFVLATHKINGAKSWFSLGGFAFQPVDLVKLLVILMLAKYFSRRHVEIKNIKHIVVSSIYALVPMFLIMLQPDFGSAMIIGLLWFGIALVAGISKKHLFILLGIVVVVFSCSWMFLFKPYQKDRIINFVNPGHDIRKSGYNVYQSTIAVGSGGFLGKGLGYGTQSRLNYLPEYKTDFMFAAFTEEWGFIGGLIVVVSLIIFLWRILQHAEHAASNFETLFCVGYALLIIGHAIINIGMNIGIMPVTGVPLPFMSYGGSHIFAECVGLGIIISMSRYERSIHRDDLQKEFYGYNT